MCCCELPWRAALPRLAGLLSAWSRCWSHGASLFAFENDSNIRDPHWLLVDPGIQICKNLRRKLAVLLLGPNVLPSIMGHHIPGKCTLIGDPTPIETHKPTSFF